MIPDRYTLDTNILVYVVDRGAGYKQALAKEIVRRSATMDCRLTLQSISEFFSVVLRRKLMDHAAAAAQVDDWLTLFPTLEPTPSAVRAAIVLSGSGRTSYWDGLLIEIAIAGGCTTIVTEDLHDGAVFGGAVVCHPFIGRELAPNLVALLT